MKLSNQSLLLGGLLLMTLLFTTPVFATDQIMCGCSYKYIFLTEKGESCSQDASCLAQGNDLTDVTVTAVSEDKAEMFELGPYKQGDTFGVSSAAQALEQLGNVDFFTDGSLEYKGDSVKQTLYFFSKAALDRKYSGTKIVQPNKSSDWELDLTQSPICLPPSQQSTYYAFSQSNGRYALFTMNCTDQSESGHNATPGSVGIGSNSAQIDPITSLAKNELNRIGTTDVQKFLGKAISVIMGVMGSIALGMFVYAGFLFMISGTTDSVEKARSILVWSSMGIVVVFASYALVQLIFATF